jgi:DNA-binding phage protein
MRHKGMTPHTVSEKSGVGYKTLVSWLYKKRTPTLTNFRAAANAVGYELVLVPIDEVDRYTGPTVVDIKTM